MQSDFSNHKLRGLELEISTVIASFDAFKKKTRNPVVTRAAKTHTEPDHQPNLPLFAPAYFC